MSSLTVSTINALNPTAGVAIPQFVPASQFSHRNKIINGKMDVAQRGTSFPAIANNAYSLDRWIYAHNTTAVATVTQQADVPASNEFQFSYRYAVTTADTSITVGDNASIVQLIEGYNVRDLIGRTFTLSFWVRSSKTGVHCIALTNSTQDRSYVAEYTVNAANTWEQKSITVSGGLITAGTWDWTTGIGLRVRFSLAAGSTFHTTAGAWQTGTFLATANQVNCLDTIGNIFAITGVQLEPGSVATPFEHRQFGAELALCQRYYVRYATNNMILGNGHLNGETQYDVVGTFPVPMRTAPTATALNAGSIQIKLPGGSNQSITNVTAFLSLSTIGYRVYGDMPSFGSIGQGCYLFSNADGRGFEFSSEL